MFSVDLSEICDVTEEYARTHRPVAVTEFQRDGQDCRGSTRQTNLVKEAFSKSSGGRGGSSTDLLTAILRECPDLVGQMVCHPDQGLAAHTIMFTTKVAKGPREEAGIPVFEQEYKLMLHAAGKVPFMPAVTDVGKDAVFYLMERGRGVIASRELYDAMTEEQQTAFGKDIALFIHRFAEAFTEKDVQEFVPHNNRGSFLTMSQMEASLAHPVVREYLGDSLAGATAAAQEYGSKMVSSKENGVFHRDLNNGNILINENKLSKVLDYGNMQAGPLEESLASLYWNFPPAFTKTVCREFNTLSERKIEYRDVVLCQIASTLNFLRNNAEQGIKNDEGWLKEWLLKSLDEIVVTKPAPHDLNERASRPVRTPNSGGPDPGLDRK